MFWVVCRLSAIRPFLCIRRLSPLRKCSKKVVRKALRLRPPCFLCVAPRIPRVNASRTLLSRFSLSTKIPGEATVVTDHTGKYHRNCDYGESEHDHNNKKHFLDLLKIQPTKSQTFDRSLSPNFDRPRSRPRELMNAKCEDNEWIGVR